MSAWMPAPPPESEPATISTRAGFGMAGPALCGGVADEPDDFLHHVAHELLVVALAHDAYDRLGARLAHQEASAGELLLAQLDRGQDFGIAQGRAVLEAHVVENLRRRLEDVDGFAGGAAFLGQDREHLKRRDQSVAGGNEVGKDDVAGLLATDVEAAFAHLLDDVAIAHRRAHEIQVLALQIALEADIRHHGADDAAALELAGFRP